MEEMLQITKAPIAKIWHVLKAKAIAALEKYVSVIYELTSNTRNTSSQIDFAYVSIIQLILEHVCMYVGQEDLA